MSDCCVFEPKIRFDCLAELVSLFRKGELVSKKSTALQHAACFLGCYAATLEDSPSVFSMADPTEVDHYLAVLEEMVDADELLVGEDPANLDPATIIAIIGVVIQVLAFIRKRRENQ